ncbi:MAG: hypothetical protein JXR53_15260 [Bacteroidales bacterium]|nr:hypothetical protein [Bacteroidales bacterium]
MEEHQDERDDGVSWMPRDQVELEYQDTEDNEDNLDKDIIVGPIKDAQTPYLQVVFGERSSSHLLISAEVINTLEWSEDFNGPILPCRYPRAEAAEGLGSLVRTEAVKTAEFIEGAENQSGNRLNFVTKTLGGYNNDDIPDAVDQWLQGKHITGDDKGERMYKYIKSGIPD